MRKTLLPYVFLFPALVILAALAFIPTVGALNLSIQDRILTDPRWGYIGLDNYKMLFGDKRFYNALMVSLKWEVATVLGTMLTAILGGIMLFERTHGGWRRILSLLFFIPVLLPRITAAYIWKFMLSPLMGIINIGIISLGGSHIEFLSNPAWALYSVAMVDVWQWGLFFAVVVLNLLETLPQANIDCAVMECNNKAEVYWYVALPMLKGSLISITFVKMIESLRSFDLIYIMTGGGPGISTETVDMYAFMSGISVSLDVSYASSMAVLMMIVTVILFTFLWKRASR